jgi:hypothetical protein
MEFEMRRSDNTHHCWDNSLMKRAVCPLLFVVAIVLAGCADGSALITGQTRNVIEDHTSVRILTAMPEGAEMIAIVKASSDAGWTQQESLDYAVDEIKRQAAEVGANAIVLTGTETSGGISGIPVDGGGTLIFSYDVEVIEGLAVWID